jgi:hypothetical protein
LELAEKIDYNKYFESMGTVSGSKAAEYSIFSKRASMAAAAKLDEFLALMDREQLDAARSQVLMFALPTPDDEEEAGEQPEAEGSGGEEAAAAGGGGFSAGYGQL